MGYPSYLEDIKSRLAEDLALMYGGMRKLGEWEGDAASTKLMAEQVELIKIIHRQCKSLLTQIESLLDLGTSPEIDLAFDSIQAKDEIERLKLKNQKYYKQLAEYDARVLSLQEENKKLKKENKALVKKINDPSNYEAMMNAYSGQSSIELNKPNEFRKKR